MTGDPALTAILARAAAFGAGPRHLRAETGEEALGILLDAIAACVAPRLLTIIGPDGPILRAEAHSGGLSQLLECPAFAQPEVVGSTSRALHADDLEPVAKALLAAFPGDQNLTVETALPPVAPDPAQGVLSADALRRQMGLALPHAVISDPLSYLIDAAQDVLLAVIRPGPRILTMRPDTPLSQAMATRVEAMLTASKYLHNTLTKNDFLFFRMAGDQTLSIGLTRTDKGPAALVIESEAMAEVAAFWASLPHVPIASGP
ncbi:hypothetical protein [Mameliella sediminis]|uniref:hypothetical protein n=1 Tax=Mameliella sediminis TaxID=2836866 RepID=UPI001C47D293|nr:hypothetical protein [Mameliella sediminis]MBV7396953.1 hypothetical protein [Mameliella sediminis]